MARILVIEDNPENLALMGYLLRAFGHSVLTAEDGEAGLARAEAEPDIDLIVCDVHLPKLDGYAVARRLKAHPRLAAVPLVAVTALAMVGDREKVLAAGFDGYIPKPIAPREFAGQVQSYLPGHAAPGEAVAADNGTGPGRKTVPAIKGPRILVVDDSPANRSLAQATLAPFGYRLHLASSVAEAFDLLARQPFDLIISDLRMPGGDGLEFLARIKSDPALSGLPVVLLSSSFWGARDRERAQALGAARFLERPVAPRRLLDEIKSCLALSGI